MPKQKISWGLFIAYASTVTLILGHHEMWRDELQTWGIASSADSFAELLSNSRYEGHPMLWFVLVWPLTKLWSNPVAIQVLHGLLAITTGYLIVFRSPFTFFEKVLILFSYYFIYEYAAISRNYQIGVLLLCTICVYWKNPTRNLLPISILLFLLCQTNVFAFCIGVSLSLGLLVEEYKAKSLWPLNGQQILAGAIVLTGIWLTSRSMPPADSGFLTAWNTNFNLSTVFFASAGIAHGFLPVTDFSVFTFWNYSLFPFSIYVKVTLGAILLVFAVLSRPTDRVALVVLGSAIGLMFVFTYLKPRGNLRHFGHYFLALLAAYWIQATNQKEKPASPFTIGYFGVMVLIIQVLAAINALYRDIRYPFSMSKSLAVYIQANYPASTALAGVFQDNLTAPRWYLQKPVYYLDVQEYGTHVYFSKSHWNDRLNNQSDSATYARYVAFEKMHKGALLIMTYHSVPQSGHFPREGGVDTLKTPQGNRLFACVKTFDGSITGEDYYLFKLVQ